MRHLLQSISMIVFFSLLACSESTYKRPDNLLKTQLPPVSAEEQKIPTFKAQFISWKESFDESIKDYKSDCQDCPASVAQILIKDFKNQRTKQCFGGLFQEDLVLASRHCLHEYQLAEKKCKGSIRFLFPGNKDFSATAADCVEVKDFIPEPEWVKQQSLRRKTMDVIPHPDWVLLRINKKMPERFSKAHKDGIGDKEKLSIYFPQFNPYRGTIHIEKVNCESVQKSPFFPFFINDKSPMASVRCDKQLTNGSSGSNLFNSNGEIVGTLSHGLAYIRKNKRMIFKRKNGGRYSPWAAINNMSCIFDVPDGEKANCIFQPKQKLSLRRKIFSLRVQDAQEKAKEAFKKWVASVDHPIEWEFIEPEDIDSLPESYRKVFEERAQFHKRQLTEEGKTSLTRLFLPAYPKCLKEKTSLREIPYPVAQVRVRRDQNRRVKVDVEYSSTTGLILKPEGADNWRYLFSAPEKPHYQRQRGDFFSPRNPPLPVSDLPLCQ